MENFFLLNNARNGEIIEMEDTVLILIFSKFDKFSVFQN